MRVLSQSEIDNILSELLSNPSVLPVSEKQEDAEKKETENDSKAADS
ncbi:MAG: hypothetical protein FWD48_12345 [Oscillospiraceae bacterium]|nr:hypothetical protein [Oscillospiraceae bacterium]